MKGRGAVAGRIGQSACSRTPARWSRSGAAQPPTPPAAPRPKAQQRRTLRQPAHHGKLIFGCKEEG